MSGDLRKIVYQNSLRRKEQLNKEMLIALFGGSGKTGIYYVEKAVNQGHKLKVFVRDEKKMAKMVDKLKLSEEKKSLITIKETDIFKAENLDLTGVHVVVSCLGFHRRNNKGMKIDHYTRSMDSILTACKTHSVTRLITMAAWYSRDRGDNIEGQGVSGCMAKFFLRHMIGHVLVDMDDMEKLIEQDAHENLQWQVISFPGLRKRSSDGKELLWEIDCDMVTEIVKKYSMYKTKYYTIAFCDAADIMLKITEEKYGLPKNHLIAVANKY